MNNGAIAAGVAAGATSGVAIGLVMQEEQSNQRRYLHEGRDQILIETPKNIKSVGTRIANIFDNWYFDEQDNSIYYRKPLLNRILSFIGIWILVTVCAIAFEFILWMGTSMLLGTFDAKYPVDTITALVVSIMFGFFSGVILGYKEDERIGYIRLSHDNGKTRILVKVYDDAGYRNLDEDNVAKIREAI